MNFFRKILKSKKEKKKDNTKDELEVWKITSDTKIVVDIGGLYTKYGPTTAKEPRTFPTLLTESVMIHYGSYLQAPGREFVGFDALESTRVYQIKCDPVVNWDEVEHFAKYAMVKCYHPTEPISENMYEHNNPILVLQPHLSDYYFEQYRNAEHNWRSLYDNRDKSIEERALIFPPGCIVVDLGHTDVRFHVIHNAGKTLHSETLDIGGSYITSVLYQLVHANGRTWNPRTDFSSHAAKEKVAFVSTDLNKSLKEFGYQSNFLNHLAADSNSYLHLLPNDILTQIHKCHINKFQRPAPGILEKLGCIQISTVKKTDKISCYGEFEIGAERFLAMEVLFQPFMVQKNKSLQGILRELIEKYQETNIILQGGMSKCPGLKERLLLELQDLKIKITVNEYLNWTNIKS